MKISKQLLVVVMSVCLNAPQTYAQGTSNEWEKLNQDAVKLYEAGNYADAVVHAQKALKLAEQQVGPEYPAVSTSLNSLALIYKAQGQYAQAEPLYKRALLIKEKALGLEHPDVATSLNNLAGLYSDQGLYPEAERLYQRSLAIDEKILGSDDPDLAISLNNLALVYVAQSLYTQAEPLYKRALAINEKTLGSDHPGTATSLNNLAGLYSTQGLYAQAEPLFIRSLAIREKTLGSEHPKVASSLNNLASLYKHLGQYAQAEPLYKRALTIREKALGSDHPDTAISLSNLADLYEAQGQYDQAEPLYKQTLAIIEKALGTAHPYVATCLNNLAALYHTRGQYTQAEPLYKRALAITEKAQGSDHPDTAISLSNLAGLYKAQGQYDQAEPLFKQTLAIIEKALGGDHPYVANSLNNLAALYSTQGQYTQAEPLYKRALTINEKVLGLEHPGTAVSLGNLASIYNTQGQYAQAESLYKKAIAIQEKTLGSNHPDLANSLNNLANLYKVKHQYGTALPFARKASAIYRQRIITGGTDEASIQEAKRNLDGFYTHLILLAQNRDKGARHKITDESLQLAQLAQATGTGAAVAKMAARFASGDDTIAALVKRKQDAVERRSTAESNLVKVAGQEPAKRNTAAEQQLRDELVQLGKDIATVDAELNQRFPAYQVLTHPDPLTVRQVQAQLLPQEAMLVYAVADDQSWLWVVRPDQAVFLSLNAQQKALATQIKELRTQTEVPDSGPLLKVNVATLHALYQQLFAPALPYLKGTQHLMVVPAGPLQSLPLSMLVARKPPEIKTDADYRQVDWLINHYAISVLPSVGSIRAFRQFAKAKTAQKPFIGFGDPLLKDDSATTRKLKVAGLFRSTSDITKGQSADIADVDMLRRQYRLPESADEIKAMAKIMQAGANTILLQDKATETSVKKLDLSQYRILAFATHGVMADEIGYGFEAGLILTPPKQGTLEDDGYLSAGEIAKLKLNADWVLLSACNTAAADGTLGAEGLSGLAKAFFYAGSRSLLVSHWPVSSQATVPLTTTMLREYEAHPEQGKAEAQRKAMLALMNTPKHPEYAHPLYWAPFVVVGEGGK